MKQEQVLQRLTCAKCNTLMGSAEPHVRVYSLVFHERCYLKHVADHMKERREEDLRIHSGHVH